MFKIILFFLAISSVYQDIDKLQQKQGGEPLAQSPVVRTGCGCLILFLATLLIAGILRGSI